MARGRRKAITYSSRETKVAIGLVFLLISVVLLIALLGETPGDNLFTSAKKFFGQALVIATFASFNLSLYYLDIKYVFSSGQSVAAQFGLSFMYPTLLSSLITSEQLSLVAAQKGLAGGQLGHYLAWEIFFDRPFAQYTPQIVSAICLILFLVAISVSVEQIANFLRTTFSVLIDLFQKIVTKPGTKIVSEAPTAISSVAQVAQQATRFSDLKKEGVSQFPSKSKDDRKEKDSNDDAPLESSVASPKSSTPVSVKETDVNEGLISDTLAYPNWQLPPLSLLSPYKKSASHDPDVAHNTKVIEKTLSNFSVDARVEETFIGPSVVRYALDIPVGIKVTKVKGYTDNIAMALGVSANQIRIEPIPGTTYLGIEAPRQKREPVYIKEMAEELLKDNKFKLGVTIGKSVDGEAIMADIQKMPHLLIAGATGSGKSVLTNAFITSLLLQKTPDEAKLILVDPKQVELIDYDGIPHLLTPVITDMNKVINALEWCVQEMEHRYTKFAEARVRNIEGYNEKMGFAAVPYIVVVIDEMADMMLTADRNKAETAIVRLAQKARATGIHLILATQRPSVNVITGIIKANIPGRIGMSVTSGTDSRVIMDQIGAESLLGYGDLLYKAPDKTRSERIQSPLITQAEIERVVNFIKSQAPEVSYAMSILDGTKEGGEEGMAADYSDDDLFTQAVKIVVNYQKGSSSYLQRRLNIGFNRAARLLDEMEEAGVVGPPNGSKPRDVLVQDADAYFAARKAQG